MQNPGFSESKRLLRITSIPKEKKNNIALYLTDIGATAVVPLAATILVAHGPTKAQTQTFS
jgi:hypothetical protein